VTALTALLEDATAGDPVDGMRWTHRSTRSLAAALRRQGYAIGHATVARLLADLGYSLRTNRKRLAGTHDPERDRQFRMLARRRRWFQSRGWPVLSVDTKKKEWLGNFKNPGRCWRRQARDVLDHDFPSAAVGRAIPYGIYDGAWNAGYVVIGTSHETPEFAVAALRSWWLEVGQLRYPTAGRLAIEADCGGANGNRSWRWKQALQRLANETRLTITVGHLPTAASKWNRIEHRMFSLISANWAAEPLLNYETILNFIRSTCSSTGFRCQGRLDQIRYPTRLKVSSVEKEAVRQRPHKTLPKWNYTISPEPWS
jgi:Rhodopirellula transposase DDE domain